MNKRQLAFNSSFIIPHSSFPLCCPYGFEDFVVLRAEEGEGLGLVVAYAAFCVDDYDGACGAAGEP
jgi:hypothetical protein